MTRRQPADPARYAARVALDLADAEARGRTHIRRRVTTVLNGSGWERRTRTNLKRIRDALAAAGVHIDTDITNLGLARNAWIYFASTPFVSRDLGRIFGYGRDLKWYVAHYPEEVFRGLPGLEDLTFHRSEMPVEYGGELHKIGLLFRDPQGTYVAIALERGDPRDDSVAQLERYLRGLQAEGHTPVRGLLITARPSGAQLEADVADRMARLNDRLPVQWFWYDLNLSLRRIV